MKDQDVHEYLTGAQFAELAQVDIRTVRKWASRGVGPRPTRPAGSRIVRYWRSEVEAWLRGEPVQAGAGAAR